MKMKLLMCAAMIAMLGGCADYYYADHGHGYYERGHNDHRGYYDRDGHYHYYDHYRDGDRYRCYGY